MSFKVIMSKRFITDNLIIILNYSYGRVTLKKKKTPVEFSKLIIMGKV